jgi:hypothetical protein
MKFSGHDSFYCKSFWLKKGYDFVCEGKNFNDENAVIDLGVGKNMVSAIRFWLKAFDIIDDNSKITEFGNKFFDNTGYDPFIENMNTLWLLHYYLVKKEYSSIYSLVFNEFRKERFEFKKDNLLQFIKNKCATVGFPFTENSVNTDISVFFKTYFKPDKSNSIEDEYNNLFLELNLIYSKIREKETLYFFNLEDKNDLAPEILLFLILEKYTDTQIIDFNDLLYSHNSFGSVFCLSKNNLVDKIKYLTQNYPFIVYSDDAGIGQIQLKGKLPDKWSVLDGIYKN